MLAAGMTRVRLALACAGLLVVGGTLAAAAPAPRTADDAAPAAVEKVDFERHIMGLFGRLGCNSGSCHGSFQGKGGFRLSLFGYDPEKDHLAVTRDAMGRRVDPTDPDNSLLLLKATGQVNHGGGVRFGEGSWQYRLFRRWIAEGARWEKGRGEVARVTMTPPEYTFRKAGDQGQLRIKATFADGSEEDITAFCDFRTNDDAIALVTPEGRVTARQPGDTTVVVSYRGNVLPARVLVPVELPPGTRYPKVPAVNYLDREVFAKLRRLNIIPADRCDDATFLRRVTIDTLGTLPTPEEVRRFLADRSPDKRARKIDELLAHPDHAALWATKFSDITGNNTDLMEQPQQLKPKRSQMWHDWFRKRVAENMPYDEIVRGVLCATSREGDSVEDWLNEDRKINEAAAKGFETPYAGRDTLDLFWRRQQRVPPEQWGEKTAAAFLGVRLECAQCHKHPFDRWTQAEYRSYANIFTAVNFGQSPEARKAIAAENERRNAKVVRNNQRNQVREVFLSPARRLLTHPDTNKPLPMQALGGPEIEVKSGEDPREVLFKWLRSPDNPYFARSFVNRVWGHYFGVGIVDPVDDFSLGNPPSNDKLLDALARDFVKHRYDIRHVERTILNSRAYQLASATNETNRFDRRNYSHSYLRPMMAEVVVDVLNAALGTQENFGNDAPKGARAIEVGASRLQNGTLNYAFRIFGRPPRTAACDCERAMDPALPQRLYTMADPVVINKLTTGRLRKLLADRNKTDDAVLEDLFLATVSRFPTDQERRLFAQHRATAKDRATAFADALWALVNTTEFILNH